MKATYDYFYLKTLANSNYFFTRFFQECHKQERTYEYVEKKINNFLKKKEIEHENNIERNWPSAIDLFYDSMELYSDNFIKNALKNELKSKYGKDNESFSKLVSELALYEVYRHLSYPFRNKRNEFETIFYKANWKDITYNQLYNSEELIEPLIKNNYLEPYEDFYLFTRNIKKLEKTNNPILEIHKTHDFANSIEYFNDFERDEKLLLLNLFIKLPPSKKSQMPLTELMSIVEITGSGLTNEITMNRGKNINKCDDYNRVSKGLKYYGNPKKNNERLDKLKGKCVKYNLKTISDQISLEQLSKKV